VDYRLLYTQKALNDLAEITSYIAETDTTSALRFGTSLIEHASLLTRFPHMGSIVRKRPKVRKILHSPFLVYYHVCEAAGIIEIVHIRHGARKPPKSELR
jgi:plasmid stabilization system protein ParE